MLDIKLFYLINGLAQRSDFWDGLLIAISKSSLVVFSLVLAFFIFKNRQIFWVALLSAILSRGIFTEVIRYFYQRPRPYLALADVNILAEINRQTPAFPSGHSAFMFAIAFAIYLFDKKIGLTLVSAALVFGFARVYIGIHWPSDILGGILAALLSVYLVFRLRDHFHNNK